MRSTIRRWSVLLAMAIFAVGHHGLQAEISLSAPESAGFTASGLNDHQNTLRQLVDEGRLAGVTTLVARDGNVVLFDAYGIRDMDSNAPVERDTIFRIASMTKPIVGVAMMMLWEEGKLSLDDPVAKHIPEFDGLMVATDNGEVPQKSPMTMRQLMSHTAGFDVTAAYGPQLRERNLQDMIDQLASQPLAFQPGTEWRYGPSVDIQGYVVEKLSGTTLDVFLRERIFEPLGMVDTGFWVEPEQWSRVTKAFTYDEDGTLIPATDPRLVERTSKPSFLSGGGGLFSTTEDYFRFSQMLLDGGIADGTRFLEESTVELMYTNVLEPDVGIFGANNSNALGFGMDFAIALDPEAMDSPLGVNSYYWRGAFGTWFWIDPTNDIVTVGMIQNSPRAASGTPPMADLSTEGVYAALSAYGN